MGRESNERNLSSPHPHQAKDDESYVWTAHSRATGHSVGITREGHVLTWGRSNRLGQLGRPTATKTKIKSSSSSVDATTTKATQPGLAVFEGRTTVRGVRAYAGGSADAGHTAVIDQDGDLWMAGCDRWQQLGLGSSMLGATGYTWKALYQTTFQRNDFVRAYLRELDPTATIRDVAIGGDHTIVLSSNGRDVIAFGKGGEGQLGLHQKCFVSAPMKSKYLSSSERGKISAVCAFDNCSAALSPKGEILSEAGKCHRTQSLLQSLVECRKEARLAGLLSDDSR